MAQNLFMHIPKNAGASIGNAIDLEEFNRLGHHPEHDDHLREVADSYDYIFCSFRNPFERVISAYFFLLDGGVGIEYDLKSREKYITPYYSYEDFVLNGGLKDALLENQVHFMPQNYFITDLNGKLLVNDIVLVCNLEDELEKIENKVDADFDELKTINTTNYEIKESFFRQDIMNSIKSLYKNDIKLYLCILFQRFTENIKVKKDNG